MATKFKWQAPEFEHAHKSVDWFWAVGIITTVLIVGAVLLENLLFALLIFVGSITLVMYSVKDPETHTFQISKRGISIGGTLYPFKTLESFWVEEEEGEPRVLIKSKKVLMPYLVIPLKEVDPEQVRRFLLEHLTEEYHEEPFSQQLMEVLGF